MAVRAVRVYNAATSQWEPLGISQAELSAAVPQPLGVADAGEAESASRSDHVHAMPSASDVGAQPADADLTAIAGLAGNSGLLKKTAANAWSLDTNTYLTGNETVTLSGDATGSGSTSISLTLSNSGVVAGTYNDNAAQVRPFTVDAKGRITSVGSAVSIAIAQSAVTNLVTDLALKAPLDSPTLTGTPTAPTAAASTNSTQIATTAFVQSAISSLIDGAPATLDTLNELAAALNDDSSYASTITNSLALKADLASPTFTGTPAAPTAAADNNTTQIATTAYVVGQASSSTPAALGTATAGTSTRFSRADHVHALPSRVEVNAQTISYTLAAGDEGRLVEMGSGSAITLTVPADDTVNFPTGTKIDILRTGSGEVSIAGATTPSAVTVNSEGSKLRINAQWQAASLVKRAANTWVLVGALKT